MAEMYRPLALERHALPPRIREKFQVYGESIAALALLALAAWVIFSWTQTIEHIVRYYSPLPAWDYWRTAFFLPSYRAFDMRVLWHQHNEHRIVFPEIIFAADYLVLRGRQLLPLATSFCCYVGSWAVLVWAFWSTAPLPRPMRLVASLLAGAMIGWRGSAAVLSDSFLLQWTLMEFAVLLSLACIVRLKETGRNRFFIATICWAEIATYSSGNGLLLWPLLLSAAVLLSIQKRKLIILSATALISIAIYFIDYQFTGTLSISKLLLHPVYTFEFTVVYLSMPFGALKSTVFGIWLGIFAFGVVIVLGIAAFRRGLMSSRPAVVLFGFYVFVILTALLIAAGRADVNDRVFANAKPPRYVTEPLIAWGAFIMLCIWLCAQSYSRLTLRIAIASVISVLMLVAFPKFRWWLAGVDNDYANRQLATLSIELGVEDPSTTLNIFPDPHAVRMWTATLRQEHVSAFYKPRTRWLGKDVRTYATLLDRLVPGEITYTFPVLDGIEVGGWFDDSYLAGSSRWLLLANEEGKIVGFGRKLPAGFPHVLDNSRTPPALGWVGFVNLKYPSKYISAYVINKRGVHALPGSVPVSKIRVTAEDPNGRQVPGVTWKMDGTWIRNDLPRNGFFGQSPGVFYNSWEGNDANTGRITSSVFRAPTNACVILPVLQGARSDGLSAEILDADSGRALASVPFQNAPKQWIYWRLPLQGSPKRLQIVAEDRGKAWGEWLAIGYPLSCQ